jgi:hypothetical protein
MRAQLGEVDANGDQALLFDCPGCGMWHGPIVKRSTPSQRPLWDWNGDLEKPTLSPSILVTWEYGEAREKRVCHSFVRAGRIEFLGDCTHKCAGQTVDLPEFDG